MGIAFPNGFRPGIKENGFLREANATGIFKARVGFPNISSNIQFFFGIVEGHPGASYDCDDLLTTTAAGVLTFVEDNFAGFWYDGRLTNDAEFWRTIAGNEGGGVKAAADARVLTAKEVAGQLNYMNRTPTLSPVLSVEVIHDGTVEFYWNGERVMKLAEAVNPEVSYSPILLLQTETAAARKVGVDYMDAEWQHYMGPHIP